jgi:VanZ family protein
LIKFLSKAFFCLALVAITVLALLPIDMLTAPVFNWWDKAQHAAAFALLTAMGLAAFPDRAGRVAVGLVFYGGAIELAQLAVGWRFGEWQDLLADTAGVLAVWAVRSLWPKRRTGGEARQVGKTGEVGKVGDASTSGQG